MPVRASRKKGPSKTFDQAAKKTQANSVPSPPIESNEWDAGWAEWAGKDTWSSPKDWELNSAQLKVREHETHVDQVKDLVPFWIRSVEAAERGEELKLESFLNELETDPWKTEGWGVKTSEEQTERERTAENEKGESHGFVEAVALEQSVNEERKREMHTFFAVHANERKAEEDRRFNPRFTQDAIMAPLPQSLSPHICIQCSEDLNELLSASSLPSLPHVLQSFSPLSQVTTRTTSLVSVNHPSFNLRFSDLAEIERACHEDEDERAIRTIDWIGARIQKRCTQWIADLEKSTEKEEMKSPWWEELKRCVEGDHVPSKTEAWNHPAAIILAVSTNSPNPLQAITALHSRALDLPPWVDRNILRYILIVHPSDSALSDEEATALFNAVKKQYGLHSYLLTVSFPKPPPPAIPVPVLLPRLPPVRPDSVDVQSPTVDPPPGSAELNTIRLSQPDIQQIARFAREFLVMSLLPWMEKCVLDWNETFNSNRRLPSRLFSSTRRLFGSTTPSPAPMHHPSSSISSISRSSSLSTVDGSSGPGGAPPSQQRRLAEFATILGDYKLATAVWEALRKENKGGSDILPLLLAPSPALPLHASAALASLNIQSEPLAFEQLSALKYAVRWEAGISTRDFIDDPLDGEKWLVQAAGNSEEPTAALLVAHGAWLCAKKQSKRRAAFWYFSASHKLEKSGIKPLTMYFLRKSRVLYETPVQRYLSPSFWENENLDPDSSTGMNDILAGIGHPLGRLLYTSGNLADAVRIFLELLKLAPGGLYALASSSQNPSAGEQETTSGPEKIFLEDFRMALSHFKENATDKAALADLQLPFEFCLKSKTKIRLSGNEETTTTTEWEALENDWRQFRKSAGATEALIAHGKAAVKEAFWVDICVVNPFNAEVDFSNATLGVKEAKSDDESQPAFVQVETIEKIVLAPRESRMISLRVECSQPASLTFSHLKYDFLGLLPSRDKLASRGRRLHDTPAQRQKPTYAADQTIRVDIETKDYKLIVDLVEDQQLFLAQGEIKPLRLWFSNVGNNPICELWAILGDRDGVWLGEDQPPDNEDPADALDSENSLKYLEPQLIPLSSSTGESTLNPGDSMELPILLHASSVGQQQLKILFVYREEETDPFYSARVAKSYEVHPILDHSLTSRASSSMENTYLVDLELTNLSAEAISLTQLASVGISWKCSNVLEDRLDTIQPAQISHISFNAEFSDDPAQLEIVDYVSQQLEDVINERQLQPSYPPSVSLAVTYSSENSQTLQGSAAYLLELLKRRLVLQSVSRDHPDIPVGSYKHIFPLYNPSAIDFVLFWRFSGQQRSGFILIPGPRLGAAHGSLNAIIREAEEAKVKRSMYAETQRERQNILEAIRTSEWNLEKPPLVVRVQEPPALTHDFGKGACHARVTLTVRNYSSTHSSRFAIRPKLDPHASDVTAPYIGQLSFRGTLKPLHSRVFRANLWITQPGAYDLGEWNLVTEVLEEQVVTHRYEQEISGGNSGRLTVNAATQGSVL